MFLRNVSLSHYTKVKSKNLNNGTKYFTKKKKCMTVKHEM